MIQKGIDSITKEDLHELKNNSVCESKTLEYKKELNLTTDSDKKEFLADIVSFANTSDGDIIYGISEKAGIPNSLDGIEVENIDQLKQKIESLLLDGIEPRISSIVIKEIVNVPGNYFLIIRIPKSWSLPHRLSIKNNKRFYARNSNGKYELEIGELRRAFLLSDTISTNLRVFRQDRISQILSSETPMNLSNETKVVLHLIPLISINQVQAYDIKIVMDNINNNGPLGTNGWDKTYNFEGVLTYDGNQYTTATSYTQFYKNGIIEAVTTRIIYAGDDKKLWFPNPEFEKVMFDGLRRYFSIYNSIQMDYPVYVVVTLLNYKGVGFGANYNSSRYQNRKIDRDILLIPEVLVEDSKLNFHTILRPIFDCIWNTCGYERCLNYDNNGSYTPK